MGNKQTLSVVLKEMQSQRGVLHAGGRTYRNHICIKMGNYFHIMETASDKDKIAPEHRVASCTLTNTSRPTSYI